MKRVFVYLCCQFFITVLGVSQGLAMQKPNPIVSNFRQFSENTDPGEYLYLYKGLPTSVSDLCVLIKKQLIHPTEINAFPEIADLESEDERLYSVKDMLKELVQRNSNGLTLARKPAERLRLSCRFHALLLASILKSQGVPARVRVGFAGYLAPPGSDLYCDHWICEMWDRSTSAWVLVDPEKGRVGLTKKDFRFAGEVWLSLLKSQEDPTKFGVLRWWGKEYVKANVLHDFFCVMGQELHYWEGCKIARKEISICDPEEIEFINSLSRLLINVDNNFGTLLMQKTNPLVKDIKDYPRYQ